MTDSSTDDKATDGGLEMGPSADELFGGAETESPEGEPIDRQPRDGTAAVTVEDRTAADVFDELRTEASAGVDVSDLLADESPEDIIASADEPAEPTADVDDDLTVDDETLGDLLLTDRTEGEEFLWVDAGDADESEFSTAATDEPDPADSFDGATESTTDAAADVASGDADAAASSDDATANEDDPSDASPAEASGESWASPDAEPIEVADGPDGDDERDRDDHEQDGGDHRTGDEPNAIPDSETAAAADAAPDESAPEESTTDESSTASGSTDDGPVPLVDPDSATETDEGAAQDGSTPSDDETSFRGGLVTDSPGSSVHSGGDEEPDEDDAVGTADSSDDPAGDDGSEPTREADRSADAEDDDGSSGPFALLAKLPVVGRLF